jgi:hypothetical protein
MKFIVLIAGLACVTVLSVRAQSIGGSAPGTMTPPLPGDVPPAKSAIAGSPAVGDATRDPGLAAANRSSSPQSTTPVTAPAETPPPITQPNKNYAGGTVAPKDGR